MKQHKLRIFFNTNAFWSTSGYGSQAHDLLPLIRAEGYPLAHCAFYGLEGASIELEGIKVYPKIGDTWGVDAMVEHGKDFKADIVISLQDIWVLDPNALRLIKNWTPVVPIDHDPVPQPIVDRLKLAYRIITYSKFGYEELKRIGMHSTYIPHTVDTKTLTPMNKKEAKKKLGIPEDIFLFGMVAANKDNPPRKSFQEAMDAFKLFHDKHPKSGLYIHSLFNQGGGFPIDAYAKFLGIADFLYQIPTYELMFKTDRAAMNIIYNSFDCLLAPSTNEGFGVPIIEAQSCGIPVITHDFTAMPELIIEGKTGFACKTAYKRFTPLMSYVGIPDTRSIYDSMEAVFKADRTQMAKDARDYIVKNYDIEVVFKERWVPFLQLLENEIYKDDLTDK